MTSLATHQIDEARLVSEPSSPPPPVRWSKIMDAKAAIRSGRYDDPAQLDELLESCMADLLADSDA